MNSQKRYESGFTIFEIIVVLLLLSIIAATVLGRAISSENIDLAAQVDKIRNHYRYAHSMAMKHGDAVWGFRGSADRKSYWIFRLVPPIADPITASSNPANMVMLPGEESITVDLDSKGVSLQSPIFYFDRFGRPYLYYEDETNNTPLPDTPYPYQTLTVQTTSATPIHRTLEVFAETGLIR